MSLFRQVTTSGTLSSIRRTIASIALPFLCTLFTVALLAVPHTSSAQQSSTSSATFAPTGSGTSSSSISRTLQERLSRLATLTEGRTNMLKEIRQSPERHRELVDEMDRLRKRQREYRIQCAEDIRLSNRDTLLRTTVRCYRGDLAQDLAIIRKQQYLIDDTPSLREEVRTRMASASTMLEEVINVLISALDSDFYQSPAELLTARQKLRTQYRMPYWTILLQAKADRELSWIGWMADRLATLHLEHTPKEAEWHTAMDNATACLEEIHPLLTATFGSGGYMEIKVLFSQYLTRAKECGSDLAKIRRLHNAQEALQSSSSAR